MPWYYAGPEAKPVGPVSLEELHAQRLRGAVTPETYVIEHTGASEGPGTWRRYREVFPERADAFGLPPLPAGFSSPPPLPTATAGAAAHPLFPSAAQGPASPPPTFAPTAAPHGFYPARRTNAWCAWGFGLGLAGFIFSFVCGIGLLLAAPALVICILGFAQVQRGDGQSGRGLAAAGAVLSALGVVISLGFFAWAIPTALREHSLMIEQSTTTSE